MKIRNRKTLARLASLSAAGAGALGLTAAQAHASVITGGSLTTVGFYGDVASYTLGSFGGSNENIVTAAPGGWLGNQTYKLSANGPLTFRGQAGSRFSFVAAGKTWNQGSGTLRSAAFGFRKYTRTTHFSPGIPRFSYRSTKVPGYNSHTRDGFETTGSGSYQETLVRGIETGTEGGRMVTNTFSGPVAGQTPADTGYVLFRFDNGGTTDYGWLQISLQVSPGHNNGSDGPAATITKWAYATSGDPLEAGSLTDQSTVPEPGTFYETGLAALALGAMGLRRWRKARKQES